MDSSARILAKRYARAYMASGKAHERLEALARLAEAARPHLKALTHPAVNAAVKLEALKKVLGSAHAGPAADFAALLVRERRLGLLDQISAECGAIADARAGVVRAEARSRFPLSEGELKRITALLAGATGRKVELKQALDERVLGGFEIKIGDTIIDATARGRLEALRAGLLKG